MDTKEIISYFKDLQDRICVALESLDGAGRFKEDLWVRKEGGGGRTRIIEGNLIERGGVNFSEVHGTMPKQISSSLGLPECQFLATGVSIVLHPKNPFVPIIHMNVRHFDTDADVWWFGGGIDLTPHYIQKEDATFFHETLKEACDTHDNAYYPKFKNWADDYFFSKHRNETRGIGGIFFDRLGQDDQGKKETHFDFVKSVGESFIPIYTELANRNRDKSYDKIHEKWQALRRGRYVEFNLVWDRGTRFGLETNGRTESILMSLPPMANWVYNYVPDKGSMEEQTLTLLKKGIDWV